LTSSLALQKIGMLRWRLWTSIRPRAWPIAPSISAAVSLAALALRCVVRDQGGIWFVRKPNLNGLHPAMKSVELLERAVRNSSTKRDTVLETVRPTVMWKDRIVQVGEVVVGTPVGTGEKIP